MTKNHAGIPDEAYEKARSLSAGLGGLSGENFVQQWSRGDKSDHVDGEELPAASLQSRSKLHKFL